MKTTTEKLNEILLHVDDEESLRQYMQKIPSSHPCTSFAAYFLSLELVKAMGRPELVERSGIERTYCYHILNGTRPKPGRDKILRLCLAAGLDNMETVKALEAGGEASLYAKNQRDAVILWCIEKHKNVMETNDLLDSFGMKPLD